VKLSDDDSRSIDMSVLRKWFDLTTEEGDEEVVQGRVVVDQEKSVKQLQRLMVDSFQNSSSSATCADWRLRMASSRDPEKTVVLADLRERWKSIEGTWQRLRPSRVIQATLFLTPLLPPRRIQDHHCLPAPFQHEVRCEAWCHDSSHVCATWKGDRPLEVQRCPGARFWN
jgi:hypothetical protein